MAAEKKYNWEKLRLEPLPAAYLTAILGGTTGLVGVVADNAEAVKIAVAEQGHKKDDPSP